MLIGAFFSWWYGQGWKHAANALPRRIKATTELFSAKQLLGTLFQPWRRITTVPGESFDDKLRAMGDNLVSRCVGFVVRTAVLLAATCSIVVIGAFSLVEIVVWPFVPIAVPVLIVKGII